MMQPDDLTATFLHKMWTCDPYEMIRFIERTYPKLKGLCSYDKEKKQLVSSDNTKAKFYFDPYHGVLEVQIES